MKKDKKNIANTDSSAAAAVAVPAGATETKKEKFKRFLRSETFSGYLFVLPWIIGFAALVAYPIIQTLIFSFSTVSIRPGSIETSPAGFSNYIYALITDTSFTEALSEYATEIILYVPIITVVSLIIAMLLNSKLKGTGFFRTIFFLPVIITSGPVIQIFIEQGVASFPGVDELINFEELASTLPEFLVSALQFLTSEFIMILWFSGIQILVFMTGLQKMDKSMYEAAKIDGASGWEMFWKITLPALNPTIVLNVVFTVVMQSVFSLNPIIVKIQNDMNGTGEGAGYGYASAMAWIYFAVILVILGVAVLIFKKHEKRSKRL
ncbi:MAG TPA: sugar ABC transporter permease [Candidatus Coproplasma excrementipullorum]|nr:sugar ABC transporter permease [Candidatus Coproplasma excrementipullorum]